MAKVQKSYPYFQKIQILPEYIMLRHIVLVTVTVNQTPPFYLAL